MRLLDLFCGAGGAAVGYHRAGFDEIVGVDINSQPRYPFEFVQGDALEFLQKYGADFDFIHASPPCQAYSRLKHFASSSHPMLVDKVRDWLVAKERPYVIENVPGAPLSSPVVLCGTMFGLTTGTGYELRRHRLFETSFPLPQPPACNHVGKVVGVFGAKARDTAAEKRHYAKPKETRGRPTDVHIPIEDAWVAMGIDWMSPYELSQSIPPSYTEWIGKQYLVYEELELA